MTETYTRVHMMLTSMKCEIYMAVVQAQRKDDYDAYYHINTFYGCQIVLSHSNLLRYNLNTDVEY